MSQVTVNFPFSVEVKDYHDFQHICHSLMLANINCKYTEIGNIGGKYIGMIYVGSLNDEENQKFRDKIKV